MAPYDSCSLVRQTHIGRNGPRLPCYRSTCPRLPSPHVTSRPTSKRSKSYFGVQPTASNIWQPFGKDIGQISPENETAGSSISTGTPWHPSPCQGGLSAQQHEDRVLEATPKRATSQSSPLGSCRGEDSSNHTATSARLTIIRTQSPISCSARPETPTTRWTDTRHCHD